MADQKYDTTRGVNKPTAPKKADDIEVQFDLNEHQEIRSPSPGGRIEMLEPSVLNKPENVNINFAAENEGKSPITSNQSPQDRSNDPNKTFESTPSRIRPERYISQIDVTDDYDKPDYDKMKKRINQIHARNDKNEPYSCCEALCKVTTGWYCLCGATRKSQMDKFGIGVVLYFRFIKYLACFFLIASILSIPALYFAIQSSQSFDNSSMNNYKGGLFFTTMGSIARGVNNCYAQDLDTTITFSCVRGVLSPYAGLKYGRVIETESISCEYFSSYSWDTKCNSQDVTNTLETQYDNDCAGKTSCQITITADFFNYDSTECSDWKASSSSKGYYFQSFCQDISLQLPNGNSIEKTTVGWIVTSFDAAISVLYLVFLIMLQFYEKKTARRILGNIDPVETYTIEVRSLPRMTSQQLKARLWKRFSKVKLGEKDVELKVVDVQLAESSELLSLNERLGNLKTKKVELYRSFYKKWHDTKASPLVVVEFEDLKKIAQGKEGKILVEFKKLEDLKKIEDSYKARIERARNVKKGQAVAAFITYEDKSQRDVALSYFRSSVFQRFWYSIFPCFFKKDPNVFEKAYLHVTDAPAPSNINWSNMNAGKMEKFLRRLTSWIITLALWIATFAFMAYVRNQQKILSENVRPTVDCSGYTDLSLTNILNNADDKSLLECYCRNNVAQALKGGVCKPWILDKIKSNALPWLIVIAILFINYLLQYVFRFLSVFERHRSSTSESVSRILKIFVAQGLNTGVIILIVNVKFNNTPIPRIFGGDYDDVTPQWYISVATTILVTMIINVISLPVVNTMFRILASCLRCLDRGCTFNKRKTKKKTQTLYENLYTGPEFLIEFRYAQILTIVFVCLLYSAGIPLLFISSLVNLVILYMMDKYYVLKVCRLPQEFDKKMQTMVRRVLFLAILLHLGNAVWIYGFGQIFGDSDPLKAVEEYFARALNKQTPGIFSRLVERSTLKVNFSLTLLFLLVLAIIVVRVLFFGAFQKVKHMCMRRKGGKRAQIDERYKDKNPYYGKIKLDDLNTEQQYLEKEITSMQNEELSNILMQRLERIEQEIAARKDVKEYNKDRFQGLFSYSVKHNPAHKRLFQAKGLKSTGSESPDGKALKNA